MEKNRVTVSLHGDVHRRVRIRSAEEGIRINVIIETLINNFLEDAVEIIKRDKSEGTYGVDEDASESEEATSDS